MNKLRISIITPSFNQKNYITETLLSVLNQKGSHFELEYIVMDGGSTDGTIDVLSEIDNRFKKNEFQNVSSFKWYSEKDKGQSDAINKGLRLATSDVVAYLNSDDVYEEGALEKTAIFFLSNPKAFWMTGKCTIVNEKTEDIRRPITMYKNLSLKFLLSYFWLLCENPISQPATFWRRSIHDEYGYFDESEHLVMDYEFWLRIGQKYKCNFINESLAKFRWYENSKSGSRFIEQFKREEEIAKIYSVKEKWYITRILHRINYWKIVLVYKVIYLINFRNV